MGRQHRQELHTRFAIIASTSARVSASTFRTHPDTGLQIYDGDSISLRSQRENKLCGLHPVTLAEAGSDADGSADQLPSTPATRQQHTAIVCGDFFTTKSTAFTVSLPSQGMVTQDSR